MKTNLFQAVLAAAALSAIAPAFADEQPVKIKTDGMPTYQRERLEAKAQQGSTALVQYLHRTRMMGNQLRAEDVVVPQAAGESATRPSEAAATKPAAARKDLAAK